MIRSRRFLTLLAPITLALSCGSGSGPGPHSDDLPSSTVTPTHSALDAESLARAALVDTVDLPSGWQALAHQSDPRDDARANWLDHCLAMPAVHRNRSAVVYSDFASADKTLFVSSENDVLESPDVAHRVVAASRTHHGVDCLRDSLVRYPPTDAHTTLLYVSAAPLALPDGLAGARLTLRLRSAAAKVYIIYSDVIWFAVSDVFGTISVAGVGVPPPTELDAAVVTKPLARVLALSRG